MDMPVYLFTGFLEAGKTKCIQETLEDKEFNKPDQKILVISCEEGIEELDPTSFADSDVVVVQLDDQNQLTPKFLTDCEKKYRPQMVMVEYNGMWPLDLFYSCLPENWFVYQEMLFADASTIQVYNQNMRTQFVDKLQSCEIVIFNRVKPGEDVVPLHQMVRTISKKAKIAYEYTDGSMNYDEIQDPLPFDINADIIEIQDTDYAEFYRDIADEMQKYNGKTVKFKGMVAKSGSPFDAAFAVGRHVMTCCEADTTYRGLVCTGTTDMKVKTKDWVMITAKITIQYHKLYGCDGPVLTALHVEPAEAPEQLVATFY